MKKLKYSGMALSIIFAGYIFFYASPTFASVATIMVGVIERKIADLESSINMIQEHIDDKRATADGTRKWGQHLQNLELMGIADQLDSLANDLEDVLGIHQDALGFYRHNTQNVLMPFF